MNSINLTPRDVGVLKQLKAASIVHPGEFVKPMWIGGRNGSHHSYTLSKLVKRGFAERKAHGFGWVKGSWRYRITDKGVTYLEEMNKHE